MIAAPLFSAAPVSEANITLSFNLCGFFVYLPSGIKRLQHGMQKRYYRYRPVGHGEHGFR